MYLWGSGYFGEYLKPHKVIFGGVCKKICIGNSFGVVVDVEGKVYSWGSNSSGQLGLGNYENRETPFLIEELKETKIESVACGGNFCIGI